MPVEPAQTNVFEHLGLLAHTAQIASGCRSCLTLFWSDFNGFVRRFPDERVEQIGLRLFGKRGQLEYRRMSLALKAVMALAILSIPFFTYSSL